MSTKKIESGYSNI